MPRTPSRASLTAREVRGARQHVPGRDAGGRVRRRPGANAQARYVDVRAVGGLDCIVWWDGVRGASWGLEYLDLLRDIWASELTSQ